MKSYVSRRYLKEKWENLKWDMEKVIRVYDEEPVDNVAEQANKVSLEIQDLMQSILKEIG